MTIYSYVAKKSGSSKIEKGVIEAENVNDASRQLRGQGYLILNLNQGNKNTLSLNLKIVRKHVALKEKIIFTRQLSLMLKAGLPVVKALEALRKQTENNYFKEVISSLITDIKGGVVLSRAMAKYPKVFPEVYLAVVKAGEESGHLSEVLYDLATQQEKDADLIAKIKGAMIYPAVILVALIAVAVIIVVFVLPSLQSVFAEMGSKLPIQTRILMGISEVSRKYFYIVLPILIGLFYLMRLYLRTDGGRVIYDKLKITAPIFGMLTKKLYMARFSRTLALLTKSSYPILSSIKIVKNTIANVHYQEAFNRIEAAVESGKPLSFAIEQEDKFPPMVSQLTSLGEESGNLESVLLEVANFYDKEVDQISKNLATLIEPLLMVLMGLGVAFIVASVLGPIYGLVQQIQ